MPKYGILKDSILENIIIADDEATALEATGAQSCVLITSEMQYNYGWIWNIEQNKFIQPEVISGEGI